MKNQKTYLPLLYVDTSNTIPIKIHLCFIVESLAKRNVYFLCITETWLLPSDVPVISATFPSYSFHLVPRSMSTRGMIDVFKRSIKIMNIYYFEF